MFNYGHFNNVIILLQYAVLHFDKSCFSITNALIHVQIQSLVFEEVLSNSASGISQSLLQALAVAGHVDICTECR